MYGVAVSVRLSRQSSQQSAVSSRIGDNSAQWGVTPWVAWSVVGGSPIFPQKIIALLGTGAQRGPLGAQVKRSRRGGNRVRSFEWCHPQGQGSARGEDMGLVKGGNTGELF